MFYRRGKFIGCLLECCFSERDLLHRVRHIVTVGGRLGVCTVCDYNEIYNLNISKGNSAQCTDHQYTEIFSFFFRNFIYSLNVCAFLRATASRNAQEVKNNDA